MVTLLEPACWWLDEAKAIANILRNSGEPEVNITYLTQFEKTTTARPYHFNVSLSRRLK